MGFRTYYVALPFLWNSESGLVPGEAKQCPTASNAIGLARFLALTSAGAIAFSRTGDPSTGEYADAIVLEAFGEVLSLDDLINAYA